MKILFLITFSFIINIYAQFTSGTDYSGKTEVIEKNSEAGVVLYSIKSDIKWEFVNPDEISFTANSNMSGFGFGLSLNIPTDTYEFFFKADHIYRDISNSASKNEYITAGEDPVYTNIDVEDFSLNQARAESGMDFLDSYKLSARADYVSEEDENSMQFGGLAEYIAHLDNSKSITIGIEYNSKGDEDLLALRGSYAKISPNQLYSAEFIWEFDAAKLSSIANYSKYYSTAVKDKETDYFNFGLGYDRSFKTAGTNASMSAGSNLTKDFTSPIVNLPYFYYELRLGTEFLNKKVGFNIGWNYGMYKIAMSDRVTIPEDELILLPEGVEDITENIGSYTLDIKLFYRF